MLATISKYAAISTVAVLTAQPCRAAISFDMVPVDNTAVLTGYSTYDLQVTTDTDWTGAAMLLDLSAGSLYQHAYGGDTGPANPALIAIVPKLVFDTYVIGSTAGGAGDVGGDGYAFGTSELDVSWFNLTPDQTGATTIGRVTFTDDAAGTMAFLAMAGERAEFEVSITPGYAPLITPVVQQQSATGGTGGTTESAFTTPTTETSRLADQYGEMAKLILQRRLNGWVPKMPSGHVRLADVSTNDFYDATVQDESSGDSPLPEPGMLALIGFGVGVALLRRRGT